MNANDAIQAYCEGWSSTSYEFLGCFPVEEGVLFRVWAPNAEAVSVVGDWNYWSIDADKMGHVKGGIWEGIAPNAAINQRYKFAIRPCGSDTVLQKADPCARRAELPPATASIVWKSDFSWTDEEWMSAREHHQSLNAPISIYELHLGSWKKANGSFPSYKEIAKDVIAHVTRCGFTHIELLPISGHPFYGSWGYQCLGYFAPTARYGSPDEFKFFVNELHRAGIGIILDWVPAHFPVDDHGLKQFDGSFLYEHADPRKGFHPDWKTAIFNYDRHEVRSFLLSSADFWLREYHIDGIRVDAVASMLYLNYSRNDGEWIPNETGGKENWGAVHFLKLLNDSIQSNHPGALTIAEESTAWPQITGATKDGGLGFHLKWDMGWMHDTLTYAQKEPLYRAHHHGQLTFRAVYAFSEQFVLALSHDEVVHGKGSMVDKMPGDHWQKLAHNRLLWSYQMIQPGKKMLFMGMELGQYGDWNHDEQLQWHLLQQPDHAQMIDFLAALHQLYRSSPALYEQDFTEKGTRWLHMNDSQQSIIAIARQDNNGQTIVGVCNWTPVVRYNYVLPVPHPGTWIEVLNSDDKAFGGSGVTATAPAFSTSTEWGHRISISIPPLGASFWILDGSDPD